MANMIKLAQQFSKYPVGRFLEDGPFSGQLFRQKYLEPAMGVPGKLVIDLDGVRGVSSSFLEEAFGGLVRAGFGKAALKEKFDIRACDGSLRMEILDYIDQAEPEHRAGLQRAFV